MGELIKSWLEKVEKEKESMANLLAAVSGASKPARGTAAPDVSRASDAPDHSHWTGRVTSKDRVYGFAEKYDIRPLRWLTELAVGILLVVGGIRLTHLSGSKIYPKAAQLFPVGIFAIVCGLFLSIYPQVKRVYKRLRNKELCAINGKPVFTKNLSEVHRAFLTGLSSDSWHWLKCALAKHPEHIRDIYAYSSSRESLIQWAKAWQKNSPATAMFEHVETAVIDEEVRKKIAAQALPK